MNDMIRIDPDELSIIAKGLRQLGEEMELLRRELWLAQYRLSCNGAQLIEMHLMHLQRSMDDIMQRMQETSEDIIFSADQFSGCEHLVKRYFLEGRLWQDDI